LSRCAAVRAAAAARACVCASARTLRTTLCARPPPPHPPSRRADPPKGAETWTATEGGFSCALDLVKHIRAHYGDYFCVSVSGYPEGHPNVIKKVEAGEALSASEASRVITLEDGAYVCRDADYQAELAYLKAKVDAGATLIITQMFFDADVFLQFSRDCRAAGISVPIMPGIMLIQNYGGFKRMTAFCKSRVPAALAAALDAAKDDDAAVRAIGIKHGADTCRTLAAAGVKGLHLYTLNLEAGMYGVLKELGLYKPFPEGTTFD
jgi:methylenetetrahydrofolate reductase (NADPH)